MAHTDSHTHTHSPVSWLLPAVPKTTSSASVEPQKRTRPKLPCATGGNLIIRPKRKLKKNKTSCKQIFGRLCTPCPLVRRWQAYLALRGCCQSGLPESVGACGAFFRTYIAFKNSKLKDWNVHFLYVQWSFLPCRPLVLTNSTPNGLWMKHYGRPPGRKPGLDLFFSSSIWYPPMPETASRWATPGGRVSFEMTFRLLQHTCEIIITPTHCFEHFLLLVPPFVSGTGERPLMPVVSCFICKFANLIPLIWTVFFFVFLPFMTYTQSLCHRSAVLSALARSLGIYFQLVCFVSIWLYRVRRVSHMLAKVLALL